MRTALRNGIKRKAIKEAIQEIGRREKLKIMEVDFESARQWVKSKYKVDIASPEFYKIRKTHYEEMVARTAPARAARTIQRRQQEALSPENPDKMPTPRELHPESNGIPVANDEVKFTFGEFLQLKAAAKDFVQLCGGKEMAHRVLEEI